MKELTDKIELVKKNPVLIQRAIIDYLEDITNDEIKIVDATNPFVLLLEASSVNTAIAVNNSNINLRKQYASLAISDEDIYRHMSDTELVGRFSTPSEAEFVFMLPMEDLHKNMIEVNGEYHYKLTIARDTYIEVDDIQYTLSYPIDIKQHTTGGVSVNYDTSISSPIETVKTNNIIPLIRTLPDGKKLIYFKVTLKQLKVVANNFTIEQKAVFRKQILFTDKFFYARAYHNGKSTSNEWREIRTTHTDQVYDLKTPTVCFKVYEGYLEVYIPHVYIVNDLIGSSLRIELYTTKGKLTVNYSDYLTEKFSITLRNLTDTRDTVYSNAMLNTNLRAVSTDTNTSGENGISFEELRKRVIYHATGEMEIPITNVQNRAKLNNKGFDVVTNIDAVTNRTMLATKRLPSPVNRRLLTPVNTATITTVLNSDEFIDNPFVVINNLTNRTTILPNNLYLNNNGKVEFVSYYDINRIKALSVKERVNEINSKKYLYTPYYYVLDYTAKEFNARAYDLDNPTYNEINFVFQNDSMQMPVNTDSVYFLKNDEGYELIIKTKSGNFYKQTPDQEVGLQVGFYPKDQEYLAYINAELVVTDPTSGERIWRAKFITNYDIDSEDCLHITNAKMFTDSYKVLPMSLDSTLYIMHHSSSVTTVYKPDSYNQKLGYFILDINTRLITFESLNVTLGYSLDNLWKRSKLIPLSQEYLKYDTDVELTYDKDIYKTDSNGIVINLVNGELQYEILHRRGDPVLDENADIVYKNRAGDVYLDENGEPIVDTVLKSGYELDIFFIDGAMYFITDDAMLSYRKEIVNTVTNWITRDIKDIEAKLLERTSIYYYPQSTLGSVDVIVEDGSEYTITSAQSFTLKAYVSSSVYENDQVCDNIRKNTIEVIDKHLKMEEVNMSSIIADLKDIYSESVISFDVSGLGGSKNLNLLRLKNPENRLCINKRAISLPDDTILIEDDVTINFLLFK